MTIFQCTHQCTQRLLGMHPGDAYLDAVEEIISPLANAYATLDATRDELPAGDPGLPAGQHAAAVSGAAVQHLLQYSPDLNPIEIPFSKFKAFLRKVSERTPAGPALVYCENLRHRRSRERG